MQTAKFFRKYTGNEATDLLHKGYANMFHAADDGKSCQTSNSKSNVSQKEGLFKYN